MIPYAGTTNKTMQHIYILIGDAGDGSNTLSFYKGRDFNPDLIREFAEQDKYDSYASGDGIQITTMKFPNSVNLDDIEGITWETAYPGIYNED